MRDYGERVSDMAGAVPQLEAPDGIRHSLFDKVDRDRSRRNNLASRHVWRFAAWCAAIGTASVSRRRATSLLMVALLLLGGIWISQSSNQSSPAADPQQLPLTAPDRATPNAAALASESSRLIQRQETATAVARFVNAKAYTPYDGLGLTPPPGTSLRMLRATTNETGARGVLISSTSETMLLALNLPPLPSDKVYQIWLVRSGHIVNAGLLPVDSVGFGQAIIIPYLSLADYQGIGITVEPASGSAYPTGESILQGDL